MVIATIIILISLGFWVLIKIGKEPYIYKDIEQNDINNFIEILLNRGYDKGFLMIEIPNTSLFIQYLKYINNNISGIQLDFPCVKWSIKYYEKFKSELYINDIAFEIIKNINESVVEIIRIDFKKDLELANDISMMILNNVFLISPEEKVQLYFKKLSPHEEKIGR